MCGNFLPRSFHSRKPLIYIALTFAKQAPRFRKEGLAIRNAANTARKELTLSHTVRDLGTCVRSISFLTAL
jgi:hypothetical protein